MGRMHNKGKGISDSILPWKREAPTWLRPSSLKNAQEISQVASTAIHRMAKKGLTPSQIGVALRDSSRHSTGKDRNWIQNSSNPQACRHSARNT